jgi:hypothetical protein
MRGAYMPAWVSEGRLFFSEEKNQKTFNSALD